MINGSISLFDLLAPYPTISLIGMAKNAGKTTVLNYLINKFKSYTLILTSIGRDGEETDIVTSTKKPRIYVPSGSVIITAEGLLGLSDITIEVLMTTNLNTPMGRIVVVRALSDGFVQLGGPSMVNQLEETLNRLKNLPHLHPLPYNKESDLNTLPATKTIIDGAVSRKSPASPTLSGVAVLCTGASLSPNINNLIAETKHIVDILTLPASSYETKDNLCLTGAISDKQILELLTCGKLQPNSQITLDDPSKIFISSATLDKLRAREVALAVKSPINVVAVTINPVSPQGFTIDPKLLRHKLQEVIDLPVFDVVAAQGTKSGEK